MDERSKPKCDKVRAIRLDGKEYKTACVYDTAEVSNPAHAEIGLTRHALEEANQAEMRRQLMLAFNCNSPLSPESYRNGEVLNHIAGESSPPSV
jgi:hypothetical protein